MTGYLRRLIASATREAGAIHPVLPSLYGSAAVHSAPLPDLAADATLPAARDPPRQPHPFPEPSSPSPPPAVAGRNLAADATLPAVRDPPRQPHPFPGPSSPSPPPAVAGPPLPGASVVAMGPLPLAEQPAPPARSLDSLAGDRLSQPGPEQPPPSAHSVGSVAVGDRLSQSAPEQPAASTQWHDFPVAGDRPSAVVRGNREGLTADDARGPAGDLKFVAPPRLPAEPGAVASSRRGVADLAQALSAAARLTPAVGANTLRLRRVDLGMADQPARGIRRPRDRLPEKDDIQIHIGRIEVTAIQPAPPRPPPAAPARRAPSLDEYLKRRNGRAS
jgi:hypothetical protein